MDPNILPEGQTLVSKVKVHKITQVKPSLVPGRGGLKHKKAPISQAIVKLVKQTLKVP